MIPAFLSLWIDKALEKLPWIAKIPFYLSMALIWLMVWSFNIGMELPTKAQDWFDGNYDRKSAPLMAEIKALREDMKETKQDTRDIRNHLMGTPKGTK